MAQRLPSSTALSNNHVRSDGANGQGTRDIRRKAKSTQSVPNPDCRSAWIKLSLACPCEWGLYYVLVGARAGVF